MARDIYRGSINNSERSKAKLLSAVGEIIRTSGYQALTASKISKAAGVDRKLIVTYFDTVDNLVETYVRSKDYWIEASENASSVMEDMTLENLQVIMESVLIHQFEYFQTNDEMQKIVLWQLSEKSKVMFDIAEEREKLGSSFFNLADSYFENKDVDIRAIAAILVAGIYYLVLHSKSNNSLFCQIDVNEVSGAERIKDALKQIVADTFHRVKA